MIIRFDKDFKISATEEESIIAGNDNVNEIKIFMYDGFDFLENKAYLNFELSDGKQFNNRPTTKEFKLNENGLDEEQCFYYIMPKYLLKQPGRLRLTMRISPLFEMSNIDNSSLITTQVYYAVFPNGEEIIDPKTEEMLRQDIANVQISTQTSARQYVDELARSGAFRGEPGPQGPQGPKGDSGTDNYNDLKNKPKINGIELSGDIDIDFVNSTTDNLINYYTKTQTYNKDEINSIVNNIQSFNALIVVELPTENISTTTIYLIPKMDNENNDYYDEYLYINNSWEMIGNTKIDLSNYYNKDEIDGFLSVKVNDAELSKVAKTGEYEDLKNKPQIPDVSNFVTKDVSNLTNYYKKTESNGKFYHTITEQSVSKGDVNATVKRISIQKGNDMLVETVFDVYEYGEAFYYDDDEIHLTPGKSGLMSPLEKGKLDRIDESAVNFAKEQYEKSLNKININGLHAYPSGMNVSAINNHISIKGIGNYNGGIEFNFPVKLKPNTEYTLKVFNQTGTMDGPLYFWDYDNVVSYGNAYLGALNSYDTFTTPATVSDNVRLNIYYETSQGNIDVEFDVMLVEGNKIPTEFQSYKASSHITNSQAEFLKEEYEKQSNLLDTHAKSGSITINGMTCTQNSDGSITLNGTNTAEIYLEIVYTFQDWTTAQTKKLYPLKNGQTYSYGAVKMSGTFSGNIGFMFQKTISSNSERVSLGEFSTFNDGDGIYRGWINIISGTSCSDLKIGAMVCSGSIFPTTYLPYQGGEIVHRGDITPTTLFEGDSSGNIILSQSRSNFKWIKITYRDNAYVYNTTTLPTNVNNAFLITGEGIGWNDNTYFKTKSITINDNEIISSSSADLSIKGSSIYQELNNNIYIVKVEGGNY